MTAELITPKSNSLEDLQEYISDVASVVRDSTPKSAEKLWNRLLKESFGGTASRVFEYIPCTIPQSRTYRPTDKATQFFGFGIEDDYFTTMRELLNWRWTVEECLEVVNFSDYRTFTCMSPYLIYGQLSTHNQITSISHSQRYGVCDRGYWMPPELEARVSKLDTSETTQHIWNELISTTTPNGLKAFMKGNGITRKEVWDRGSDMLQNRVFTLGGYTSNPNAFPHFINQRLDNHCQKETREFVQQIKDKLNES